MRKGILVLICVFCLAFIGCDKFCKSKQEKDSGDKTIKIVDLHVAKGEKEPEKPATTFTKNSVVWLRYDIENVSYLSDIQRIAIRQDLLIYNPNNEIILAIPGITNFNDVATKKPRYFVNRIALDDKTMIGRYTAIVNIVDLYSLQSNRQVIYFDVNES